MDSGQPLVCREQRTVCSVCLGRASWIKRSVFEFLISMNWSSPCLSASPQSLQQSTMPCCRVPYPATLQPAYLTCRFHRLWFVENLCTWWPPEGVPRLRVKAVNRTGLNLADSTRILCKTCPFLFQTWVCVFIYVYMYTDTHDQKKIYMCVCVCVCLHTCMYV